MENASKALLIAGEVLIGLIVLTIFAYTFEQAFLFAEAFRERADRQKIIAFNTEFTKYVTTNTGTNKSYIYAEDIVSIINRATDWNEKTADDNEKITVEIQDASGGTEFIIDDISDFDQEDRTQFLTKYKLTNNPTNSEYQFSCRVTLRAGTGRVNRVIIKNEGVKTT